MNRETRVYPSYYVELSQHDRGRLADGDRIVVDLPDGTELRVAYGTTAEDLVAIRQGALEAAPVGTQREHLRRALRHADSALARYHIRAALQYADVDEEREREDAVV